MAKDLVRLERYAGDHAEWDAFVRGSKNGTFLLERGFMDYHGDRFHDASLVARAGSRVVAVLPANRVPRDAGDRLESHGGLTYGGWVTDSTMGVPLMLEVFEQLERLCRDDGITEVRYKPTPKIYHSLPSDEDEYALFRVGARCSALDVSSVVDLRSPPAWGERRRRALRRARARELVVGRTSDVRSYWRLLTEVLEQRHGVRPTHTSDELELLAGRFPEQVVLYTAAPVSAEPVAGVVVFDCGQTVHLQYIAAGELGRAWGALDLVISHLQHDVYADRRYLSFGISTESGGRGLNRGLVEQKEMLGGRAVVCPTYDWEVDGRGGPLGAGS